MSDIGDLFASAEKGDAGAVRELGAMAEDWDHKAMEALRNLAFDGNIAAFDEITPSVVNSSMKSYTSVYSII